MKILYITGREAGYPRNDVMLRAFRRFSEVDVLSAPDNRKSLTGKSVVLGLKSIPKLLFQSYDLVYVGFYGHLLMLPAGWLARRPILFDAFLSTYDTLIDDRKVAGPGSLAARLARWLDVAACNAAARVLVDTPLHLEYFVRQYGLDRNKFASIPIGCSEDIFYPRPRPSTSGPVRVIYSTTYLPLHGIDVVVQAADRLRDLPLQFSLFGSGLNFSAIKEQCERLRLDNVRMIPMIPFTQLVEEIAAADICLGGHFGVSEKAGRVVPGKLYQILAMKRAVLAGDTPANRDLLEHGKNAFLCRPGDPDDMAEKLRTLCSSETLREQLAEAGYRQYQARCSEAVITRMAQDAVSVLVRDSA